MSDTETFFVVNNLNRKFKSIDAAVRELGSSERTVEVFECVKKSVGHFKLNIEVEKFDQKIQPIDEDEDEEGYF